MPSPTGCGVLSQQQVWWWFHEHFNVFLANNVVTLVNVFLHLLGLSLGVNGESPTSGSGIICVNDSFYDGCSGGISFTHTCLTSSTGKTFQDWWCLKLMFLAPWTSCSGVAWPSPSTWCLQIFACQVMSSLSGSILWIIALTYLLKSCGSVFWPHMLAMTDSGGNHKAIGGSSSWIQMWFNNVLI